MGILVAGTSFRPARSYTTLLDVIAASGLRSHFPVHFHKVEARAFAFSLVIHMFKCQRIFGGDSQERMKPPTMNWESPS
jgi:hypothetical protein